MSCTGVILAGGRASRYGGLRKGELRVGGRRIVDRVAAALRQACETLVVVGAPAAAAGELADELPLVTGAVQLHDPEPHAGPLAALAFALGELHSPLLLVAWDMPFASPSLLGELRRVGERGGAAAVLPESDEQGRLQPLCAYYAPTAVTTARALVARGERRMRTLADLLPAERLPLARVLDFGDPRRLFLNVNTPSDHAEAEHLVLGTPDAMA